MADFRSELNHLNATLERENYSLKHPGLAIGITDRERLIFQGAYGLTHRDKKLPVTPETLFQIGSISKSFTSIVLLQLQEEGLLDLDDLVTKYLPWFKVQSDFEPISLRHLMSHTAGIIMGTDATTAAFTEAWNLRHTRATAAPGEIFHYSNSGYKILGLVLQAVLGQHLSEILSERIFNPLGMSASEPVITHATRERLAVGYEAYFDDRPYPRGGPLSPAAWFESDTADGSISATAEDMCRYLRSLLNRGRGLLPQSSFDQLIHPLIPTGDDLHGDTYALGLCIRLVDGNQVVSHSGGMVGYYANIIADLDAGMGVVVLTNTPGDPERISEFAYKILRSALKDDEILPDSNDDNASNPAEDYIGAYKCGDLEFTITARDGNLSFGFAGEDVRLEPRGPDDFLVPHLSFELFLLRFIRKNIGNLYQEKEGVQGPNDAEFPVLGAVCGGDFFLRGGYTLPQPTSYPHEWDAYPGHYRSHNPWFSNFRVVIRMGELVLIEPDGSEEPLYEISPNLFRIGTNPLSPEFIQFDLVKDGKANQISLSGGAYSRTFTH